MSASTSENQTVPRAPSLRKDLLSAYVATGAKLGSWVIVSALVFRFLGPGQFAVLALIRGTIGLLNYISLGLSPAMIHLASQTRPKGTSQVVQENLIAGGVLAYRSPPPRDVSLPTVYSNALLVTYISLVAGLVIATVFGLRFESLLHMPVFLAWLPLIVLGVGAGTLFRLAGDAPGASLQVLERIATDNTIVAMGDFLWAILSLITCLSVATTEDPLVLIAIWYALTGAAAFATRLMIAGHITGVYGPQVRRLNTQLIGQLLSYGGMVVLAQLADYLYAPTDYILIDHFLQPYDIASYAPAIQIDGALLLLVSGLSAVILPRTAIAHAQGEATTVRRYYLLGTLWSFVLLTAASVVAWLASPWIFRLWLGNSMVETQRILPILLICTTLGGSSMVGRSVLLAVGRVWPFTVAVLIAGVTNVVCSYVFVTRFGWGLRGIVLGTVVAVVGRCGIWMPWYVMRVLAEGGEIGAIEYGPSDTGL